DPQLDTNNVPADSVQPASHQTTQSSTPPATTTKPEPPTDTEIKSPTPSQTGSSNATPPAAPNRAPANPSSGDAAPEQQRRTPPTLYTLPDDKHPTSPPDAPKDTPQ